MKTSFEVKEITDIIHLTVEFEDAFSGAITIRHIKRPLSIFEKMKLDIGKVVIDRFNRSTHIHEIVKLKAVYQTLPQSRGC